MGLNTSHGCWDGSYSAFHRWRLYIASLANIPLPFMEGFYDLHETAVKSMLMGVKGSTTLTEKDFLPIKWEALAPSPLHLLINHSDCDGSISHLDAESIATSLELLLPKMKDQVEYHHKHSTLKWIAGLRRAHELKEDVIFR